MPHDIDGEVNDRSKMYKNAGKPDDLRRRRVETSVELRRQKRTDDLMKRRNINLNAEEFDDDDENWDNKPGAAPSKAKMAIKITPVEARNILINNPTIEQMRYVFEQLRRMLSCNKSPPIDEVIKVGLVEAMSKALEVQDQKVQFEAAWALTNVVSGTSAQTMSGVQNGCVKPLINLMFSEDLQLAEQATWAIANIVGDSSQLRDHVIQYGIIPALGCLMDKYDKLPDSVLRMVAWTISNLARHKNPAPTVDVLQAITPFLAKLIVSTDEQVVIDSCWALSYMTDGPDSHLEVALQAGIVPLIIGIISKSDQDKIVVPTLRTLGNFATGSDSMTQVVIDAGILNKIIPNILTHRSNSLVKESCWLISNIIAGTQEQIQACIDSKLVPLLVQVLKEKDSKSQFEASWAIANLVHGGTIQQISTLYKCSALPVMCAALNLKNIEIISNMLDSIFALLQALQSTTGNRLEKAKEQIEECGGLDILEHLQHHDNDRIYQSALKIIEHFFSNDETDDDENGNVVVDTGMQYNF